MLERQVVNLDGARRYRCPVQSKFAGTRPPPVFGRLTSRFRGIELFLPAMPSSSREEPTARKTLTVASSSAPAPIIGVK